MLQETLYDLRNSTVHVSVTVNSSMPQSLGVRVERALQFEVCSKPLLKVAPYSFQQFELYKLA